MTQLKYIICFLFVLPFISNAQENNKERNQLRYELTDIRKNFDVLYYDLDIEVNPENKSISGSNTILFEAVKSLDEIQLDLFSNMDVHTITQNNKELKFSRKQDAIFIELDQKLKQGETTEVRVNYSGKPVEAENAPWDGGFVWSEDENGKPWVGVAVEGLGASSWWPNKDHLSDEPDNGVRVSLTVPEGLVGVSNGRLKNKTSLQGKEKYTWETSYSVDNYNVTLYVGDYLSYSEYYQSLPEPVNYNTQYRPEIKQTEVIYYVLKDNFQKAKAHFSFTEPVLQALEFAFGPYPFPEDGLKYVEAPYLGMEHQGAIAYGNGYQFGWRGEQVKPYLEFDYLFVHETAHEWWGNNVSVDDRAALWIQEAFATYGDAWYVYTTYGYKGYQDYMDHYRTLVQNNEPILGSYGKENHPADSDMYYKGALMLSTLSQLVEDNTLWFNTLKKAQVEFAAPRTVSNDEFIEFLENELKLDLDTFFEQYLETTKIPLILSGIKKSNGKSYFIYKWENVVDGFDMPVKILTDQYKSEWIYPTTEWKKIELPKTYNEKFLKIDTKNFYIESKRID